MAVVFGEKQKDGWIKVTMISYQMEDHPNGHTVKTEKIPQYPARTPGIEHVQMFNPKTKKWRYDKVQVPLTNEESLQDIAASIRELADAIREVVKVAKHFK